MTEKLGIIGEGHIGSALKSGLVKAGYTDILTSNHEFNNVGVVTKSSTIFLTVRPAIACQVLDQIESHLKNKILISLVAGLSISIRDVNTFRLMTSLLISENMGLNIAWTGGNTDAKVKKQVSQLLTNLAPTRWVDTEAEVDEATLSVGAAPGWMAEIISHLPSEMLMQTLEYLRMTGITAKDLAQKVATPGGITESMIKAQEFETKLKLFFAEGSYRMELIKQKYGF
jgi:pyrroline-5-carboxylate reductase